MNTMTVGKNPRFVRSNDGVFLGVFEGLGREFNFAPNFLRALWLFSFFGFGIGLLFYFVLGFTLPRESNLYSYHHKKILGGCLKISKKTGVDLGLVRSLAVVLLISSFGTALLIYIPLSFLLD